MLGTIDLLSSNSAVECNGDETRVSAGAHHRPAMSSGVVTISGKLLSASISRVRLRYAQLALIIGLFVQLARSQLVEENCRVHCRETPSWVFI